MSLERLFMSRTDRLGDTLLALPALAHLKQALQDVEITFCCQEKYLEIVRPFLNQNQILGMPACHDINRWAKAFRKHRFQAGIFLFPDTLQLTAAILSGISKRYGPLTHARFLLLFTRPYRQKRSQALMTEAQYNLEIATRFLKDHGKPVIAEGTKILLSGDDNSSEKAAQVLRSLHLNEKQFILLHPGMGNSAHNLSPVKYIDIIRNLQSRFELPVVLSEGPLESDRQQILAIQAMDNSFPVIRDVQLPVLREIFRNASMLVAPSTGPLHLAHFVGTKTIGLFPPVKSQRRERWQPWGGLGRVNVLTPDVNCPAQRECIGRDCEEYFCMDRFDWNHSINNLEPSH